MKNKVLSVFLAVVLTAGLLPGAVYASPAEGPEEEILVTEAEDTDASAEESEEPETSDSMEEITAEVTEVEEQAAASENEEEIEIEVEDNKKDKEKREIPLPDPGTVTGFQMMAEEDISVTLDTRCSLVELEEKMPDSIFVYLDYSSTAVEIPVTWVSENDYETTNESYYIFWAEWDKDMFPLVDGYGSEDYLPFVEVILDTPVMMAGSNSAGIKNIVDRAHQMVDIRWTPVKNLNGFSDPEDPLTVYSKGTCYNGIPYGQQVSSGTWVPNSTSFDTFLNAVNNANSPLYLSRGGYGSMDSTYYANDCSSFVSYCYGLPRMTTWSFGYSSQFTNVAGNSIYNAEVGDSFNCAGAHIEIITAMNYDASGNLTSVEVSEQTPPKARTIIYTPAQVQKLINSGYTLIRYNGRDAVGAPQNYTGYANDKANPVRVDYSTESQAVITVTDKKGDRSEFAITVTGLQTYRNTSYTAAVWSKTGGQDDLKWITLSRQSDTSYTGSLKISDFKHEGTFYLHLYKFGQLDTVYLKDKVFDTDATDEQPVDPAASAEVTAESVTVENFDNEAGTCRILISGVKCADGVSKITVPVWSDSKQADIVWYQAKKLDDSTWYVDMSISNHQNNYATYHVHVYGTSTPGNQNLCGTTKVIFTNPRKEVSVKAEVNGTSVTITAENLYLEGGIKSVVVPTWSSTGAQDDLIWEKATYNAETETATVTINAESYSHYGKFYSHVYATDLNGNRTLMGTVTYEVEDPDALEITSQPTTITVTEGSYATFSVAAIGSGSLTYQWQYCRSGSTTWMNSNASTAATKSIKIRGSASNNGITYRCVIRNGYGKEVISSTATLNVFYISTQPESLTVKSRTYVTFSVTATGDDLTYQWQYSTNGGSTWLNSRASGSKTASIKFLATASKNGYMYRCLVKDSNGRRKTSSSASLSVL